MSVTKHGLRFSRKSYPLTLSFSIIGAAILLSFVDLAFLNDVIGQVLNLSSGASLLLSFFLGLIGITIMAHHGVKLAHGAESKRSAAAHYTLWISLGLAFFLIRMFSATVMQLNSSFSDSSLIRIAGINVREIDLVLAPIMFVMYLATGYMAFDGFKNLYSNPEFDNWLQARKDAKEAKRTLKMKERRQPKSESQRELLMPNEKHSREKTK